MTGRPRLESDQAVSSASLAEAWEQVLTHLEAEVDTAERVLAGEPSERTVTYVPPAGLGPPPPHLRERAWSVHDRCRAAADALAGAAGAVDSELRTLHTGSSSRPPAVYVDSRC